MIETPTAENKETVSNLQILASPLVSSKLKTLLILVDIVSFLPTQSSTPTVANIIDVAVLATLTKEITLEEDYIIIKN